MDVINNLSSLITVGGTSITAYSKVQGAVTSEAYFKSLAETLLQCQLIWKTCYKDLKRKGSGLPTESDQLILSAVQECKDKSEKLRQIFEESISDPDSSNQAKFWAAWRSFADGDSIEEFMKAIKEKTSFILQFRNVTLASTIENIEETTIEIRDRTRLLESAAHSSNKNIFNGYGENMNIMTGSKAQMFLGQSSYNNYVNGEHHYHYNEKRDSPDEKHDSPDETFTRSLEFPEMNSRLDEIKCHEEKTFEWAFRTDDTYKKGNESISTTTTAATVNNPPGPAIKHWLEFGEGVFLILGKPGSGKSTFMKFLYKDQRTSNLLRKWGNGKDVHLLFHSFWGMLKESATHNWEGLLAHLICQLVPLESQNIAAIVNRARQKVKYTDWSSDELKSILMTIVRSSKNKYCLLIDGLDEVGISDEIREILVLISGVSSQTGSTCKICLATRQAPYIEMLEPADVMEIHRFTETDLKMFVNARLRESKALDRHLRKPDTEVQLRKLVTTICSKAQGVWIWVYHVVTRVVLLLPMERNLDKILDIVDMFPESLTELYRMSLYNSRRHWTTCEKQRSVIFSCGPRFPMSLFQLAITVDGERRQEYLQTCSPRDEQEIADECHMFQKMLERSTGCLAESYEDPNVDEQDFHALERNTPEVGKLRTCVPACTDPQDFFARVQEYRKETSWRTKRVRFIHRTVNEFLISENEMPPQVTGQTQSILAESMLACYVEDVHPLTVASIQRLCESLDGVEGRAQEVVMIIDNLCRRMVESRLQMLPKTTQELVPNLEDGKWLKLLIENRVSEFHDFPGLLFSCESTTAARYLLRRYGQDWNPYYKGYLALCAIRAAENDHQDQRSLRNIFPLLLEEGSDLYARFSSPGYDRARPSSTPDLYRIESCISRLLTMAVVDCTHSVLSHFDDVEKNQEIACNVKWLLKLLESCRLDMITTTFFVFVDDDTDSIVIDTWWGPAEPNDVGSDDEDTLPDVQNDRQWYEHGTIIVLKAQAICGVLRDVLHKHGDVFLQTDDAIADMLHRVKMLSPRLYLSVLDHATKEFLWLQCPDGQTQSFTDAIFSGETDIYIESGSKLIATEGAKLTLDDRFVEIDDIDLEVPWDTPQKPIDSSGPVEGKQWQELCTIRDYYGSLQLCESAVSPVEDYDAMHWVYQ